MLFSILARELHSVKGLDAQYIKTVLDELGDGGGEQKAELLLRLGVGLEYRMGIIKIVVELGELEHKVADKTWRVFLCRLLHYFRKLIHRS